MPTAPRAKSPNFFRFIISGALLGFLVGGALVLTGVLGPEKAPPTGYTYGPTDGLGIVSLLFAGLFAIVAAVIAVLLDRRANP